MDDAVGVGVVGDGSGWGGVGGGGVLVISIIRVATQPRNYAIIVEDLWQPTHFHQTVGR